MSMLDVEVQLPKTEEPPPNCPHCNKATENRTRNSTTKPIIKRDDDQWENPNEYDLHRYNCGGSYTYAMIDHESGALGWISFEKCPDPAGRPIFDEAVSRMTPTEFYNIVEDFRERAPHFFHYPGPRPSPQTNNNG